MHPPSCVSLIIKLKGLISFNTQDHILFSCYCWSLHKVTVQSMLVVTECNYSVIAVGQHITYTTFSGE